MSPGTYLAKRRQAAGLSIEDVAARITSDPRLGEHERAEWLRQIERDEAMATLDVAFALKPVFSFSPVMLYILGVQYAHGAPLLDPPYLCANCACSEADPCIDPATQSTCGWSASDLCTRCAPTAKQETARAA